MKEFLNTPLILKNFEMNIWSSFNDKKNCLYWHCDHINKHIFDTFLVPFVFKYNHIANHFSVFNIMHKSQVIMRSNLKKTYPKNNVVWFSNHV
jgi:hypothetical protein